MKCFSPLPVAVAVSLCFSCASALAATTTTIEVGADQVYTEDIDIFAENRVGGIKNNGTIKNDHVIMDIKTSSDGIFQNNGSIETGVIDLFVSSNQTIGGNIKADEAFIYRGSKSSKLDLALTAMIDTPLLHIVGDDDIWVGLLVRNSESLKNVRSIKIEGNGSRTGLVFDAGEHQYVNTITLVNNTESADARVESYEGASVTLSSVFVEGGKGAIQADKNSSISVEKLIVNDESKVNIAGWGDNNTSSNITLNEVFLGKGSTLAAMEHYGSAHSVNILGDISLTLDAGAVADFVKESPSGADRNTNEAVLKADSLNIVVLDAHSENNVLLSKENTKLSSDKISVTGASSSNTGNVEADLNALGDIVQYATKTKDGDTTTVTGTDDVEGVRVEQLASDLYDGASATVGKDGLENVVVKQNTNILGIAEVSTLGLHIWRNEINDMNKRLGELRDSRGQANGIWAASTPDRLKSGLSPLKTTTPPSSSAMTGRSCPTCSSARPSPIRTATATSRSATQTTRSMP